MTGSAEQDGPTDSADVLVKSAQPPQPRLLLYSVLYIHARHHFLRG